jgi:peptidoglycan pentaglycine glycine transferase (the first glycine)
MSTHPNLQIIPLPHDAQAAWEDFWLNFAPDNLLQSWTWGDFKQLQGQTVYRFGMIDDGALVGIAQVIVQRNFLNQATAMLSRGPIVASDYMEEEPIFLRVINTLLRHKKMAKVVIEPRLNSVPPTLWKTWGYRPTASIQPQRTLVVPVLNNDDELIETFKPKTRYNIRLAQKKGVVLRFGHDQADLDTFCRLIDDTCRRQKISLYSRDYFKTLIETFGHLGQAEIITAYTNETPLASLLLVWEGTTACYLFGGTADEGRELMANYLLHFEAMNYSRSLGMTHYDFWGIALEGDAHYEAWSGITKFKLGFGGEEVVYPQAWGRTYQKFGLAFYNSLMKLKLLPKLARKLVIKK